MKRSLVLCSMTIAALLLVPAVFAAAQPYDINDATGDLEQVAAALSSIFGPNLGDMSYVGEPIGFSVIPHVSFGISGGVVFIPFENINIGTSLPADITGLESFAAFPIPQAGAHAKFTIKKKLELGVKVAGIPEIENKNAGFSVNNLIIGGKVRYNLLSYKLPLLKGGVSVGALYEYMNGGLLLSQRDTSSIDVNSDSTADGTLTTTADLATAWNSNTFGAEAQANVQVIFLNLFLGTRVSKTVGKATTSLDGAATLTSLTPLVTSGTQPLVSISETSQPGGLDPYVFGGLEIKILGLVIAGKGTYNITDGNYIVESGLRLQF